MKRHQYSIIAERAAHCVWVALMVPLLGFVVFVPPIFIWAARDMPWYLALGCTFIWLGTWSMFGLIQLAVHFDRLTDTTGEAP